MELVFELAVAVEARGWVALGFSEMGGMKGADIVIFETRNAKLIDAYRLPNGIFKTTDIGTDIIVLQKRD